MKNISILLLFFVLLSFSNTSAQTSTWIPGQTSWLNQSYTNTIVSPEYLLDNNASTNGYLAMSYYSTTYTKEIYIDFGSEKSIDGFSFSYIFPNTKQGTCSSYFDKIAYTCKGNLYYKDNNNQWISVYDCPNLNTVDNSNICPMSDSISFLFSKIKAKEWKFEMVGNYWLGGGYQSTTYYCVKDIHFREFISPMKYEFCYSVPDGIVSDIGWSYKDFVIPEGQKVDSIYCGFERPGYSPSSMDFIFQYCKGVKVYGGTQIFEPFNYQLIDTSMYNHWIDLTSFNYTDIGLIRILLPINAGAIWNNYCVATSNNMILNTKNIDYSNKITYFPNPTSEKINIGVNGLLNIEIINVSGQIVKTIKDTENIVDVSNLPSGVYFLKVKKVNETDMAVIKFIKN